MSKADQAWKEFFRENPEYKDRECTTWHFCDNKADADKLAQLVLEGTKNGTASLKKVFSYEGEEIPSEGDLSLITTYDGEPQCILETTTIWEYPFKDVPDSFAAIEGEGDGSLDYWRKAHIEFFSRNAEAYGFLFDETLTVICEQFRILKKFV